MEGPGPFLCVPVVFFQKSFGGVCIVPILLDVPKGTELLYYLQTNHMEILNVTLLANPFVYSTYFNEIGISL